MEDYIRKVQYHETDKMGITHHSNYIKWMEEARVFFLDSIGCGYKTLEERGVISPVIGIECSYKRPTTFGDEVKIHVVFTDYTGVMFTVYYIMTDTQTGETVLEGKSYHCFVTPGGRPVSIRRKYPDLDAILRDLTEG